MTSVFGMSPPLCTPTVPATLDVENEIHSLPESSELITLTCVPESGRNSLLQEAIPSSPPRFVYFTLNYHFFYFLFFLPRNLELELALLVACDFPSSLEASEISFFFFLTEALSVVNEPWLQSRLACLKQRSHKDNREEGAER